MIRLLPRRPEPQVSVSGAAEKHRSADLRLDVPTVPLDSEYDHRDESGDRDRLSSARLWCLLALEFPPPCGVAPESIARSAVLSDGMNKENPPWGAPRIHSELLMLGIEIAESTVPRNMTRAAGATFPGLENLPMQSLRSDRVAGSVRGSHHLLQATLWPGNSSPLAKANSDH